MNFLKNVLHWWGDLLRTLTKRGKAIADVIAINFYSLVLLAILYGFYWQFDQAQDLLLTLNQEEEWQVALFFITLTTLASVCWYLPKYLYPENDESFHKIDSTRDFINADVTSHTHLPKDTSREDYKVLIPRMLGGGVLFIVALGILNVANEVDPEHYKTSAYHLLTYLVLTFLVLLIAGSDDKSILSKMIDWVEERIAKRTYLLYIYFILVAAILVFLAIFNIGGVLDIFYLVLSSFLVAFSFLIFTTFRKYLPYFKVNRNVIVLILISSIAFSVFFVAISANTSISQILNPLTCANLAFILYLAILYWLRIIGKKKKIYLVTFVLLVVAIFFFTTSSKKFYQVSYVSNQMEGSTQQKYEVESRVSVGNYFKSWVDHRKDFIEQYISEKGYFPIFVIASEGGGSRAAYWTNLINAHIQNASSDFYDQHLFAMTGASGGITGNSTFFAMKEGGVKDADLQSSAREMFAQNFLSGTLTRLLGFDIWQETIGLNLLDNRAIILQEEWAEQLEASAKVDGLSQPYLSFWYKEGTSELNPDFPPLLLINTTYVQKGNHAIVSPVTFDSTYYRGFDLLQRIDQVEDKKQTLQINTATVLNASFPYICPAGFVDSTGNFVDAGYYDNLGAQTAIGLFQQMKDIQNEMQQDTSDELYGKFKFVALQIRNDLTTSKSSRVLNYQLNAPLVAAANTRSGYNSYDFWNLSEAPDVYYDVNLTQVPIVDGQDTIIPIIPLARYLSELALDAMDASLEAHIEDVNSDLNKLVKELE